MTSRASARLCAPAFVAAATQVGCTLTSAGLPGAIGGSAAGGDGGHGNLAGAGGVLAVGGAGATGGGGAAGAGADSSCGDGVLDSGEGCDDGNDVGDDGCTACVFDCVAAGGQLGPGRHCYFTRNVDSTWFQANAICEQYAGTLAVPNGDVELAFVSAFIDDCWIGAIDAGGDGFFEWITGEVPWVGPNTPSLPWKGGHPKPRDRCAKLKDAEFESLPCDRPFGRLACEVP